LASPSTRSPRSAPGREGVSLARPALLLPACQVSDRGELTRLTALLESRVTGLGLPTSLARLAFATLVDNALEHGSAIEAARVSVAVSRSFLTVTSHDAGERVGRAADAKAELRRRIQLCVEDADPPPGAPAGIPWLATVLARRRPSSELVFRAGDGQLAWRHGVWTCAQNEFVRGFLAFARVAI
jgi:hypothetical protein